MPEFIEVMKTGDLPVGRMRACTIEGRTIAVYHSKDGFFATDNECPHRGGPLNQGDLLGREVVCPWHLWGFDIATGVCTGNPEVRVVAHEVRIEDDRVLVKLSTDATIGDQ